MRCKFLEHLGAQAGQTHNVAEFGVWGRWAPSCDQQREARYDHEIDLPSACTTQLVLSYTSPVAVRLKKYRGISALF